MPWITLFATEAEALAAVAEGRLFTVRVLSLPFRLCLTRSTAKLGGWRAFMDACPHKKASFARGGYLDSLGQIVCPLHHYAFELSTGQEMTGERCPRLEVFPVRISETGALEVQLPR